MLLLVVLLNGVMTGIDAAETCNGLLSDVFAVSADLSFQTSDSSQGLSQAQLDFLAGGVKIVYNALQGGSCDNETIYLDTVEGRQVVRVRRNLAGVVTRIVNFRIKGTCRACGNKPLIGNDGARFLQQQEKQPKVGKVNRGRFMKQYRLWLKQESAIGKFQKSDIKVQSILKESSIEIVGN